MKKTQWPMKTLDELAEVKRGKSRHRPRTAAALYGGPHPFIQTADIHASEFRILKCSQSYSDFGLAQSKKWKAGTLCVTNAGENTGDCAILGFDACFPDSIIGITPLEGKADVRFLKYSLDLLRPRLRTVTKGATQDNLSVAILLSFPFPAPDLPTQRKIAGILSAYDDLIENNLRRIKILEEMAQSLYREWFIHFRFPGHESARFIDSELGRIPKGWKVTTIGEQFTTTLGGTPSRSNDAFWTNGTVPWVNSGKVNELRIIAPTSFITQEALRRSAAKLMPARTTVVAITGATLGQVSLLEIECSANQSVIGITDDESRLSEWLYLFFSEKIYEIIQHASGGAQQHINKEIVNDVRLVLPDDNTAQNFGGKISPIFDQQSNLLRRNQNLRRTRDLLLPKLLMSND